MMMSDEMKVHRLAGLILEETALTEGDRSMEWTFRAAGHIYRSVKRHSNFNLFFDVLACQDTSLCCPGLNEKLPGSAGRLNMFLLRLYRFPWLRHELQIKSTVACRYPIGKEAKKTVCLNPFHYRSVQLPNIPIPPIVVNKNGDYGEPPERPENPLDDEPDAPENQVLTDEQEEEMTDEQRIKEFRIPNVTMKGDEIKMLYERHSKFASMFPNGFVPNVPYQFPFPVVPGPDGQMPQVPQMAPNFPNPAFPTGFYPQMSYVNPFDPANYPGPSGLQAPPDAPMMNPMMNPMNPPPPMYGAPNFQSPLHYSPPPSYEQNGDQPMEQPMQPMQPIEPAQQVEQPSEQGQQNGHSEPLNMEQPSPSYEEQSEQPLAQPADEQPQEMESAQSMSSSTLSLASTTITNFFPTPPQEGDEEHFYRSGLSSPASDVSSPIVYRPAPNADAPAIPIHRAMDEVMEHDLAREQTEVDVEKMDVDEKRTGERAKTPVEPVPLYRSSPSELSELVRRAVYECVEYEEKSKWLALMYYEEGLQIGEVRDFDSQYCLVDGYTSTASNSPGRFSIGYYNNPSRSDQTSEVRSLIGKGVRLYLLAGEVYVENLSKVPVFVQSISANMKNGFPLNTVSKLPPTSTMKVFDMRQFSKQLSAAAQKTYQDVYALSRMCTIRVSFVKGWGTNYRRSTVLASPVWFQAHLYNPMAWIDSVLTCMGAPPRLCSSRT